MVSGGSGKFDDLCSTKAQNGGSETTRATLSSLWASHIALIVALPSYQYPLCSSCSPLIVQYVPFIPGLISVVSRFVPHVFPTYFIFACSVLLQFIWPSCFPFVPRFLVHSLHMSPFHMFLIFCLPIRNHSYSIEILVSYWIYWNLFEWASTMFNHDHRWIRLGFPPG